MTDSPKAVIYARISKDAAGEGLGVARQINDARALAQQRGWTIVDECTDNDISAAGKRRRPGFERALRHIRDGSATIIIAWALDRLTRNRADTVRLIDTAQQAHATIALVRGSDLDMSTPSGRLTADLLAAVARAEIEQISDRHLRKHAELAAEGRFKGGPRPYGFEADGVTVRESEAAIIRTATGWVIDGVTYAEIARRLNAAGSRTVAGCEWTPVSLQRVLDRARNAGLREHRGATVPAVWPAIIDLDTWHSLQAILHDPTRRRRRMDAWLLTGGIALCGKCGAPMQAGTGGSMVAGRSQSMYRCSAANHNARRRDRVEDYMRAEVIARLSRPDLSDLLAVDEQPDTSGIVADIDAIRQRRDTLADAYADGLVDLTQLRRATDRMDARLADLQRQLERSSPALSQAAAVADSDDVAGAWDALEIHARRDIIRALATVWIDGVRQGTRLLGVRIEWAGG